jgi:pimeloyl-ACP methyl ester carboxylesterase
MSKVFLIAGLGADTRAYDKISIQADEIIRVDWIDPIKTDTLKSYSQKLIYQYNITQNSIVIGNSLGGMIAMEIANTIPLEKTILISSIKTIDEAPRYFSLFRALPIYKLIPGKLFTSMGFMIRFVFGKMSKADTWLFNDMLKNSSPKFVKWAMGAALYWDNKIIPKNVYTITGDKDDVFDYRRINDAIIVKGGTHIMIFEKEDEINRILKEVMEK